MVFFNRSNYNYVKMTKAQLELVRQIKNSRLFDERWYLAHHSDVVESRFHPLQHYVMRGDKEGRDPNPNFNTSHYRKQTGIEPTTNALCHFIAHPENAEAVIPSPLRLIDEQIEQIRHSDLFDAKYYLQYYPDVRKQNIDPAHHYFQYGWKEHRNPSAEFDTEFYLTQYPDVAAANINPLLHYLRHGRVENKSIKAPIYSQVISNLSKQMQDVYQLIRASGLFDGEYYLKKYADVAKAGMDPLFHYINYGAAENRNPSESFSNRYYKAQMSAKEIKQYNPLQHYILIGEAKGYRTSEMSQKIVPALATGHFYDAASMPKPPGSIAVMAHMFYPELADKIASYLANIPYAYDLLISTDSNEKVPLLEAAFSGTPNLNLLIIKVVANHGRDIAPMLVGFAQEMLTYDFALHLHSKKSPYGSEVAGWLDYNLDNLLHSPVYIAHALDKLGADTCGALIATAFPPIIEHMHWENMEPYGRQTLSKLGISPDVLTAFPLQFPAGSMFWFKPKAMQPLFSGKLTLDDFEPEAAQMNGTLAHVIERLFLYVAHAGGYGFDMIRPACAYEGFAPFLLQHDPSQSYHVRQDKTPVVSIIVPVYNEWEYTANCLNSILAFTNYEQTPYEIILADDCSTDETRQAHTYFENIIISRTPQNLGFSGNCNLAATQANGQYLIFLNNDTQVQPNWLSALLDIYQTYPDALITGSKLIYADGSLQEAGGIVWENAGGANYGRNDPNPNKPEYTYIKPCDYISGAALMVTHEFWKQVDGFDKLFEPAYYEDTDLCMQARQQGGQVYLQPASQVVHFEGKSHGTDTSTGIKAYQVVNKDNFYNKWQQTLQTDHTTGKHILRARERSMDKKILVVMDYLLPEYDRHAGARHTFNYIELLLDKGYVVKYVAAKVENLRQLQFACELEQLGVETFYPSAIGIEYDWNDWLAGRRHYIDAVIFNRPFIAAPHLATCQKHGIPMLYFVHDIHALRQYRQAVNANELALAEKIKIQEGREMDIIRAMDYSYTPSVFEQQYMSDNYAITNVGVLPLYISKDMGDIETHLHRPSGHEVTFVGGMKHQPNHEAVSWFIEQVLPLVKNSHITVNIVGPNPANEIYQMAEAHDNIVIHGGVSDETLDEIYAASSVILIPLLSGAGVKGKVIEGFKNGIPIVSTAIGLEGIRGVEQILSAHDAPEDFAAEIDRLLALSAIDWLSMSGKMQNFYKQNYSFDAGWQVLQQGLKAIGLA